MAQVHGLEYPAEFLASLPILQNRPAPHTPIYAITAAQYAKIRHSYSLADVDDSVLFPFLHGLEGDNAAQNLFFSNARARDGLPPHVSVPRYRGLVSVACPAEDDDGAASIDLDDSDSSDDELDQLIGDEDDTTPGLSREFADHNWTNSRLHSSSISSTTSSSSPLSASTTATSLWSESAIPSNLSCSPSESHNSPPPPTQPRGPSHLLVSSITPDEILSPSESVFVKPNIPDGISLRNFGIQVPVYATLSDIVLYSPNGATRAVRDIAERLKEAIETKAFERNGCIPVESASVPGEFSNGTLAYNVFVVVDTFNVLEREYPELVALDSRGNSLHHTDFMAREKEEMRQLTQATQICENIWLGNTADVPSTTQPLSEVDPFDWSENPHGWDICIECRDDAYFPTVAHLRHAEEHIAKLDAAWASHPAANRTASPTFADSPPSDRGTPPLGPTLLGLSNLHVQTSSPLRGSPRDSSSMRSRSASPPLVGERRPSIHQQTPRRCITPPIVTRPPPNPSSIIHLSFPSSPNSNPHTTTQLINVLTFLARYADPGSFFANAPPASAVSSPKRRGSLSTSLVPTCPPSFTSSYQYQPQGPTPHSRPLKVLLHSLDGYTETSVLGLSYLMRAKRYSLPEAYLDLQIERSRSFFVCPGDMGVLRRVESTLGAVDHDRRREEKLARRDKERAAAVAATTTSSISNSGVEDEAHSNSSNGKTTNGVTVNGNASSDGHSTNSIMSAAGGGRWGRWPGSWRTGSLSLVGPVFGSLSGSPASAVEPTTTSSSLLNSNPNLDSNSAMGSVPTVTKALPPVQRARALTSPVSLPSRIDHNAWFSDPRFDGSFPSRVLPHLYLGNLNHAGNVYMLHALGITHVVSVGECALVPPVCPVPSSTAPHEPGTQFGFNGGPGSPGQPQGSSQFVLGSGPNGQGSLWIEEREGRIKVLDIKGVSDDGIDSLRPQFTPICDWIERARLDGGKVLVHCRVGVSRSATVTIAYVMKHLNMSLVNAYLLVRSRRLSILIQPNMRLLYNLVGWEIELAKASSAEVDRSVDARLSWPFLAREVHRLNERYLQ